MAIQKNIPIQDDLGIYAKMLLQYRSDQSQTNLALLALSQRVVMEKARNTYKKKGETQKIISLIEKINTNIDVCKGYSAGVDRSSMLVEKYPLYLKSGLITD